MWPPSKNAAVVAYKLGLCDPVITAHMARSFRCDLFVVREGKENLYAVPQGTIARIGHASEDKA